MAGLFGTPVINGVLAIVALEPTGVTFTDIQRHDIWTRYTGRWGRPKTREVADALRRLKCQGVVRECGDKWKPRL